MISRRQIQKIYTKFCDDRMSSTVLEMSCLRGSSQPARIFSNHFSYVVQYRRSLHCQHCDLTISWIQQYSPKWLHWILKNKGVGQNGFQFLHYDISWPHCPGYHLKWKHKTKWYYIAECSGNEKDVTSSLSSRNQTTSEMKNFKSG